MIPCRLASMVVAALALSAVCALTATAQSPPVPGGIPDIPSIPGQETARFKVVVEGDTFASATIQGTAGEDVGCVIKVSPLTIVEEVKYGRGKGVTMEFVRFKAAGRSVVSLQRAGRTGDASFAVRGTIGRGVTPKRDGVLTRTPAPGNPCPAASENPSTKPGCNATFPLSTDMKFVYGARAGTLKVTATSKEILGGGEDSPVAECPASELFGQLNGIVPRAWPTAVPLPAERLSARTIFGKRKSFKVTFRGTQPRKLESTGIVLKGTQLTEAHHNAVVRFTRLR